MCGEFCFRKEKRRESFSENGWSAADASPFAFQERIEKEIEIGEEDEKEKEEEGKEESGRGGVGRSSIIVLGISGILNSDLVSTEETEVFRKGDVYGFGKGKVNK